RGADFSPRGPATTRASRKILLHRLGPQLFDAEGQADRPALEPGVVTVQDGLCQLTLFSVVVAPHVAQQVVDAAARRARKRVGDAPNGQFVLPARAVRAQ